MSALLLSMYSIQQPCTGGRPVSHIRVTAVVCPGSRESKAFAAAPLLALESLTEILVGLEAAAATSATTKFISAAARTLATTALVPPPGGRWFHPFHPPPSHTITPPLLKQGRSFQIKIQADLKVFSVFSHFFLPLLASLASAHIIFEL